MYPHLMFYLMPISDTNRAFMEQLYEDYHRLMCHQAYRIIPDPHAVDDIVGDVLVSLMGVIEKLTDMSCPERRAYIVICIRNASLSYLRKAAHRRESAPIPEDTSTDEPDVDAGIIEEELAEELKECLRILPEKDRMILEMRYYQEMGMAQIAQTLGLSEAATRKRISRAKNRLRRIVQNRRGQHERD